MRVTTILAAFVLVAGLATMIPASIVGASRVGSKRFNCDVTCPSGKCSATGTSCDCWCDVYGLPHCQCDPT